VFLKAPAFDYVRVDSVEAALSLLKTHGDDARILAGGQTMMAALNMRLSSPALLVDISAIDALRQIRLNDGVLRIGAMVTHSEIEASDLVRRQAPLLSMAVTHIAHKAIRNRGTWGGSLAYADPAAEWPACVIALNATLIAQGPGGLRKIPAQSFYLDLYTTALIPTRYWWMLKFLWAIGSRWLPLTRSHGGMVTMRLQGSQPAHSVTARP